MPIDYKKGSKLIPANELRKILKTLGLSDDKQSKNAKKIDILRILV